jgi:putative DNA-invertase from lambdoid prophage Rac
VRRIFFYLNDTTGSEFPERELIQLDKAGYTVALSRVAVESVPVYVPAADRPALGNLLRRCAPEDALVVLELAALGCSPRDVLSTLLRCRRDQIAVHCVELGGVDLAGRPEPQAVKMLRALVRMEARTRSERSRGGHKAAHQNGRATGRPASLSAHDRAGVMDSLDKGLSVSEVARQFGTSRQTVLRIRASSEAQTRH